MLSGARRRLGAGRIALLPPAAFAVHQLRYELAYGADAGAELRETGHSYLHSVVPWLVALLALAAGAFLLRVGRAVARRGAPRTVGRSFTALWVACAVALVVVFAGQETLEGIFATGHPAGWAAVFGDGGWWAIPVAVAIGLVLAMVLRGADWVVQAASRLCAATDPPSRPTAARRRPCLVVSSGPAPLRAGWSSRGPPV